MRVPRAVLAGIGSIAFSLACAHAPAPAEVSPPGQRALSGSRTHEDRLLVTGSRLPQRLEGRSCIPATTSPVKIYTRQSLMNTYRLGDLAAALASADPAAPCEP